MVAIESPQLSAAERWRLAARRAGTHSLLIWPPITVAWVVVVSLHRHALAFDFSHAYLPAAHAVLHGHSPFPPATVAALSPRDAFVYPPLTAFLAAPFTVLPVTVAEALVTALTVLALLAIPWFLGVRDWRCWVTPLLWVSTYSAVQTVNVTVLLAVGLAVIWRFRHRAAVVSVVAGALIALKLFLWPLLLWLLATRRYRAALGGAVWSVLLIFGPWAVIGFAGLADYPHLVHVLSQIERTDGYTVPALLSGIVSWNTGAVIGGAIGLAVVAAVFRNGVRDERAAFALAIAATLALSPIVSMHYFVFLLVVLALFRPRFGWEWLLPILLWVAPQVGNGASWQTAAALGVVAATFLVAMRDPKTGQTTLAAQAT